MASIAGVFPVAAAVEKQNSVIQPSLFHHHAGNEGV